jgi:hypothetical protein
MDSLVVEHSPRESPARRLDPANLLSQVLLGLFLFQFALIWMGYWLGLPASVKTQWAGTALLGFAAASTLASLARQLPRQNVVLSAALIALTGAVVEVAGSSIGSSLGLQDSRQVLDPLLRIAQLWQLPLVWIVAILNCRGVVQLILRRWRFAPSYGFWLLGGTVLLAVPVILGFARFGPLLLPHFSQALSEMRLDARSVLGCAVGTFIILLVVTPGLINKKPVPERAVWHPLVVWAAFNFWFLAAGVGQRGWIVVGLLVAQVLVVLLFVLAGSRE